jgi:predicted MFS family arabinose efflux permease
MGFLAFILFLIVFAAVVTFVAAAFIRSNTLCIVASALIAELVLVLYWLTKAADSPDAHDGLLAVNITVMFFTPVFFGAAAGSTFLARRCYRKKSASVNNEVG